MEQERRSYVCGFVFTPHRDKVLLIEKTKPKWQAGKLNGIGGSIEENETPIQAMHRESKEETGRDFIWSPTVRLYNDSNDSHTKEKTPFEVFFFKAYTYTDRLLELDGHPSEHGEILRVRNVRADVRAHELLPNLHWLIPLHADPTTFGTGDRIGMHT